MITRSPVPTVAAALVLAIAVAGCGGTAGSASVAPQSGAGTQQTGTPTPPSGGSTTTSSDGDRDIDVSGGEDIGAAAYLKSITPVRLQLTKVRRYTSAMGVAIKAGDAPTAGRDAMAAAAGVRRALAIARRIRPQQPPWKTIHTQLLANLQLGVVYLTQMGRDLTAVDVPAIHAWNKTVVPTIRKAERWYREWAANVASFAALDGVKQPHWLYTMNQWN
jgi:hypothetical protein